MAKKKGILSALFSGAGSKKKGSSRASKSKMSRSKGKSAASKAKPKTKTAPKSSAPKSKVQTKKPTPKKASNTGLKAKKTYKKPLVLVPVCIKDHRDKNGGHHHVIVDDIDDNHISLGLTTRKKKGKNSTNYYCQISPLEDGKDSYMRRQAQVAPKKEYFNPREGKMEIVDFEQAKIYGARAKKKHLEKKCKKNSNEVPNT